MMKYNIDIARLSRDYKKYPLTISKSIKLNERPTKEDLEYLYLELNIPRKELCKIFNWNLNSFSGWIKYYHIHKPRSLTLLHMYETNEKKYGHKNVLQNKDIKDKIKQTNLEKYGVEYSSQSDVIKGKMRKTCLEKYGVEYYTQTEEYKSNEQKRLSELSTDEKNKIVNQHRLSSIKNKDMIYIERSKILNDKGKLIECMLDNDINNTTKFIEYFGINRSNANRLIKKYDIRHILTDTTTIPEQELIDYVSTKMNVILHDREHLNNQEIDIFIPSKNIGIEFNGNFWHSEYHKDKMYHQQKSLLAETKGIFVYHIFEYEWYSRRQQIINQLNNLLGINETKIYARKCIIKEVDNEEKAKFLEVNHMQSNDTSSIKLGLYYNEELVSLMTFVKPRFNKKYEYELSRFCSKAGTNVIGGASKLWKYFITKYNPSTVISYSNIAHTKGNLYGLLGFKLQNISDPNYVWFRKDNILTRYQCQKHKLLEQGYIGDSEVDIMHNRKYYRIYDCGNKVWVWNNK